MIRLRIDRLDYMPDGPREEGILWFENGEPVGRVIIEQEVGEVKDHPHYGQITSYRWVEVVDE